MEGEGRRNEREGVEGRRVEDAEGRGRREGDVYLCCGGLWVDDVTWSTVQWGCQQLVNSATHGGGVCVI